MRAMMFIVVIAVAVGCGSSSTRTAPRDHLLPEGGVVADPKLTAGDRIVGVPPAIEECDNAGYISWSRFDMGTTVTHRTTASTGGSEIIRTTILASVEANRIVLDSFTVTKSNSKEVKSPTTKEEVRAKVVLPAKLPEGVTREYYTIGRPPGTFDEGSETLTVAGRELKTRWYKFKNYVAGFRAEGQLWRSDDVPGGIVKIVSQLGESTEERTTELVEIKKP